MSNIRRIFESVVSVDAWRTTFEAESGLARIHVDVSFLRGKLGDDPDSPARFELALSRAEVVFVIPANEPLKVVQSTVKRERPLVVTSASSREVETSGKIAAAANFNAKSGASASGEVSAAKAYSAKESVTASSQGGAITWAQSKRSDGQYCWELAPRTAKHLLGKVWDAVSEPLLSVKFATESRMDPVVRIEIRCRREDLLISNVQIKNTSGFERFSLGSTKNKMAAAEAFIINALSSRNLDVKNFDDPFGEIVLADMLVDTGE